MRIAGAALVAGCALYAASVLGLGGPLGAAGLAAYHVVLFASALACLLRAAVVRDDRVAWATIGAGLLLWATADLYYSLVLEKQDSPPFPSIADAGWLVFYPATYVGIVLLLRSRTRGFDRGLWLDGALAALATAAVGAALAFQAIMDAATGGAAAVATNLAYPLGDLLLVGTAIAAVALTGWRPGRMWLLLAAGIVASGAADSWYLYAISTGGSTENVLQTLWPVSSVLIAAAAWQPAQAVDHGRPRGWRALLLPAAFMVAALGLLVLDHFARLTDLSLWLAAAAIAVGTLRMTLTVRENLRLLAGSREEALTDPLTGLRNRRALMLDLDEAVGRATVENPALIAVFDLNGFKGYNDAFGHPAGDELLARLGRRLDAAVAGQGAAFRLGGDEFCILLPGAGPAAGLVLRAAGAALSERGEDFSVDAAYGSALAPVEAETASAALHLADRRMYSSKHGERASAGRQTRDVLLSSLAEREPDLHEHVRDVATLAVAAGRELGMGGDELAELARAAELHDIGKLAIPDAILEKPAPLDDREWAYMRRHTLIGERILSSAPALVPVATVVRSSHERWDGRGYPDGVGGRHIPLGSRIIAVCDAYQAMVSQRPYRAARSPEGAIRELRACAGTQFDPAVAKVVCGLIEAGAHRSPRLTPAPKIPLSADTEHPVG